MKTLYSTDDEKVTNLLRRAKHVKTVDIAGSTVVSTGFSFEIHTGTKFELFYDLWNEILIFQPFRPDSIPTIAGLFGKSSNGKYFDRYGPSTIIKLRIDSNEWQEMRLCETDFVNSSYSHVFEIYNLDNVVIETFDLNRKFLNPLYNSATGLKERKGEDEYYDDEDY